MRRIATHLTLTAALVGSSFAHAADLPNYDAYLEAPALQPITSRAAEQARALGIVTSVDAQTGTPSFVWGSNDLKQLLPMPSGTPAERAALLYVERLAPLYRLSKTAISTAYVKHVHDIGRGAIIVSMGQKVNGIELFLTEMNVVMNRNLELVAIGGGLHSMAVPSLKGSDKDYVISPNQALVNAFEDLYGITLQPTSVKDTKQEKAGAHYFDLAQTPEVVATQMHFVEPARVKKMFFPMPDRLVAAYWVEFMPGKIDSNTSDAYAYVIAADDGRVLNRTNLTHTAAFNYRVWAETAGDKRPLDGPQQDWTPHPTGMPDGSSPAFIPPVMVNMDGFNTNPQNTFDPWLPAGATDSIGNNVTAYTDWSGMDGYQAGTDIRATTTSPGTFDYTYNTALGPLANQNQSKAAVTQIFYVTNWLHDWWYDSGFTESAGNAQFDNYGRGGVGNDRLRAEAQDGANAGQSNNANMSAMGDGTSPRMQMYVWDGASSHSLTSNPPGANYPNVDAGFGPTSFNYTGNLAMANPADGCGPITGVTGRVALIDRGTCQFNQKADNAENAGATGVIIANNAPGLPPALGNGTPPLPVNIPVLGISQADGSTLKQLMMNGTVSVTMVRTGTGVQRDGTIDNHIVAHEWGHYIHLRQVGGGSQQLGAMSEGLADFTALYMAIRPMDNLDGAFAAAVYAPASFGDSGFFGIRRFTYSTDMTKNCITFRHIGDNQALPTTCPQSGVGSPNNSEVHNAGEIFATMYFEAYIALLKQPGYTFAQAQRLMGDYVEGGYQAAPPNPSYTQQRDALLSTAAASSASDLIAMATAFAKRGAGTCAQSPPINSTNLNGVVEDFMMRPALGTVHVTVDDSLYSCDNDGILDGEERGYINIAIQNSGVGNLDNTQVTVSTTTPGITFPNGSMTTLASVPPFSTGTAQIEVQADASFTQITPFQMAITLNNPSACTPNANHNATVNINVDNAAMSSATDNVESDLPVWTTEQGGAGYEAWQREADMTGTNKVWHGEDVGSPSDPRLVSPPLNVSATQNFVLTMTHRHQFEFGGGTNWDGAVIEISTDNGNTWNDIEMYGNAPYNGVIGDGPGGATNALDDRQGFVDHNPNWPNTNNITIDMGTSLAGQTVKVRFRVGCDDAAGELGWYIDNIAFQGITNTPFATIGPDAATCTAGTGGSGQGGTGQGGSGQGGTGVGQGGGASSSVTSGSMSATVGSGTASGTGVGTGSGSGTGAGGDTGGPPVGDEGGCGCSTVGNSSTSLSPLAALALLALRRRRRSNNRCRS